MRILNGIEEKEAIKFIDETIQIARNSPCFRSKCGSIIVKDGKIIGSGFNAPPLGKKLDRCFKDDIPKNFKSDRSCCIHAEERTIMDALRKHPEKIIDSRLYFIRLDIDTNEKLHAGKPFCTICSKMALDAGIKEFVLWHKEGITVYDTDEYNTLSFEYRE